MKRLHKNRNTIKTRNATHCTTRTNNCEKAQIKQHQVVLKNYYAVNGSVDVNNIIKAQ